MRKKLIVFFGLLLVVVFLSPFVLDEVVSREVAEELQRSNALQSREVYYKFYENFKEDVESLRSALKVIEKSRLKDAGPFLNPRLVWKGGSKKSNAIQEFYEKNKVNERWAWDETVSQKMSALKRVFTEWDPQLFSQVDTTWLSRLREFDHWDLDKNSPNDFYPRFSLTNPLPDFMSHSATVHLVKSMDQNKRVSVEAIRDVLHFGELAFSTETLVGEMVFAAILGKVKTATDLHPTLLSELKEWEPLIQEAARLKRVWFSINQFYRPTLMADPKILDEVYEKTGFSTGLCAALRDSLGLDWATWISLREGRPEVFNHVQAQVQNSTKDCRATWLNEKTPAWVRLPGETNPLEGEQIFTQFSVSGSPVPFLGFFGRFLGFMPKTKVEISKILLGVASPNFTKPYEEVEKQAQQAQKTPGAGDRPPASQ